ncbi:MAG: helix-turn-helix domain-containing protein [Thaumarchaeota archaeon]|nr:helix-turn-helix domain-containing protein [Nitrososphaerota archaeon]MDA4135629.1 helix-turn-helix domain-containing protein [Nitrososphaerota archaeon]
MRRERILLDSERSKAKRVLTSEDPSAFFPAAAGTGGRIIGCLTKGSNYPSQIARELQVYHQTVYYHIRKLEKAGLVKKVGHTVVRGGSADLYALASDGYAVEFDVKSEPFEGVASASRSRSLARFLDEFIPGGQLDGWIVVGSPEPHGPNRTQGRDAHYAVQLGFALGQFVKLPSTFPVKLDVDLKNEKLERSNLLIIGGPRTNLIASEVNPHLPIRFSEESFWGSIVDEEGKRYLSDLDAIIVKVKNPWNAERSCVIVAGLSGAATKAAIIGLTNFPDQVLEGYRQGDYAVVLRGADIDGDGKVDSVEVLHHTKR